MSRPILAAALLFVAGLASPLAAVAQTEFCVRNELELTLALGAFATSTTQPMTIKLAQGIYDLSQTQLSSCYDCGDRPIAIRGGYNSTCTSRSEDPTATTLTTSGTEPGADAAIDTNGDIELDRLRIVGIDHLRLSAESTFSADYIIRISRVLFDSVRSIRIPGNSEIYIDNSVFWRGGRPSGPNCAIQMTDTSLGWTDRVVIRNSTFVGNLGPAALCLGSGSGGHDWTLNLTNNIFRDNGPVDIRLRKPGSYSAMPATLRNNIYATLDTNPPLVSAPVATLNVDPLFVNAAAGNFRLQGTSLAINSGRTDVNLLAEHDFDGNSRWFGDAPDRGAFESNIGSISPVLTVTNTNDSGAGSLRQALIDANAAANFNAIRFNIPGACPRTITLASLLPDILHPIAIEGYTQPGASRNTAAVGWNANLCIVLNGANQISGAYGFNVNTSASANATVSVEGIAFSGHSIAAAQFVGGRDHRFTGNQVGGAVGSTLLPSATGVRVGAAVTGVRIGGPEPAHRNIIASAAGIGINVSGSAATQPSGTLIENNYIGSQSGGDVRGNHRGILLRGFENTVRDNLIVNSTSHGIELDGSLAMNNRIENNRLGIPALCIGTCADRGNGGHGVLLRNGADGNRVNRNHIAFSGLDGVAVTGARQNTIRRNHFHDNAGIGIDLGDDGINFADVNNALPAPLGAGNDAQNKPRLTSVLGNAGTAWAAGALDSANGWYRIDFYGAPSCTNLQIGPIPAGAWGQGRDWLGSTVVQVTGGGASSNGSASFHGIALQRTGDAAYFDPQRRVLATATRLQFNGVPPLQTFRDLGTSELSRCQSFAFGIGDIIFADGFELP